jgi:hypothetical protein
MCTSLSQWLGSNGAGLVCLQLQGLSGSQEGSTTSTIISGLHHAASAAAAAGAHLQLQQLSLDGNSLLAAMPLLPLLPNLQQLELTGVNLSVEPEEEVSACLQQLREHQGITRLTINFTVTANFYCSWNYGSQVASLLLRTGVPQQVQDLTLCWHPAASHSASSAECRIFLKQLLHLEQLRQLTLDKVGVAPLQCHPEDREVNEEVVERLEQVKLLFQDSEGPFMIIQQLRGDCLPALLPKLVELHGTRQTIVDVAAACSHLTSIKLGPAHSPQIIMGGPAAPEAVLDYMRGLKQLRKLVLPPITMTGRYKVQLLDKVTCLGQLEELSVSHEPGFLQLERLTSLRRLTSLSLHLTRATPSTSRGYLWQACGLHRLAGLHHLGVQGFFLASASPPMLEAFTALTSLTVSFDTKLTPSAFDRPWQEQLTEAAADLSSCPGLQQRLRVMYATGVVPAGVRKVYRALRRALPRTRVEVVTGDSVPEWLREAA